MNTVLVVEDDPAILLVLVDNLEAESYEVLTAEDGLAAYRAIVEEKPDLVILDLMLPKQSGYEVCMKVRAERITTPILMLTARGEEGDRVLGLDFGADDYVTKPFSMPELLARVRALLRRAYPPNDLPAEIRLGEVVVDFERYVATRRGRTIDLTPKEFGMLRFLATRAGAVVSRDELLDEVWGYNADVTTRTVDTHVASLRAKIESMASEPRHLITVHGVGYKLVP